VFETLTPKSKIGAPEILISFWTTQLLFRQANVGPGIITTSYATFKLVFGCLINSPKK
jgi:hypothetical protein